MNLANAYATVIADAEKKPQQAEFTAKLIGFMKRRGHLSLLPQILRLLSRESKRAETPTLTVAKESDAKKFAGVIKESMQELGVGQEPLRIVDARAVGGFALRANSKIIDKTYRSALISMYQNVTGK